jgi:hypothetical protein
MPDLWLRIMRATLLFEFAIGDLEDVVQKHSSGHRARRHR